MKIDVSLKSHTLIVLSFSALFLLASCGADESGSNVAVPVGENPQAHFDSTDADFVIAKGLMELITIVNMDRGYKLKAADYGLAAVFYPPSKVYVDVKDKSNMGTVLKAVKALAVDKQQDLDLTWTDNEGDVHTIAFTVIKKKVLDDGTYELQLLLRKLTLAADWAVDIRVSETKRAAQTKRLDYGANAIWVVYFVFPGDIYRGYFEPDRCPTVAKK